MQNTQAREWLVNIFNAALQAVDPYKLVYARSERIISTYSRKQCHKLYVASFGKAAFAMAKALAESPVRDLITRGIVLTKYGHAPGRLPGRIEVFEAGHPVPDAAGVAATERIIDMLQSSDPETLIVCLISGGASSLMVAPADGVTLSDKQRVTEVLLKAGADIQELNTVRKHISRIKGGKLAAMGRPAGIMSLILSDVIGDPLDVIASGPTAPDATTYGDALAVIEKYGLNDKIPAAVAGLLSAGAGGKAPETPKDGYLFFRGVENIIIGNNRTALEAAAGRAVQAGFEATILASDIQGEARIVGRRFAQKAIDMKKEKTAGQKICLISGGETTVTVAGTGIGGRNTEMALAFAEEIAGQEGITFLSAGTDGTDGPTDAAGAIVDGQTVQRAADRGLSSSIYLKHNDSYTFFKNTDELLMIGSTGTNVMDLQITLIM